MPASSAPGVPLSAPLVPTDEPDEIRAIWGTTINLAETMKLFRDFLAGFKPKYRQVADREAGRPGRVFATPAESEVRSYEALLRRMRITGATDLNVDTLDILSYNPSRKLHSQLQKYPQEVIPAMDQVLKDMMLEIADKDQQEGREGMQGAQGDEEIAEIMGKVYKVRPYGLPAVNMRELNPTGKSTLFQLFNVGLLNYM
jgi:DNA replication licensing factor MCM4